MKIIIPTKGRVSKQLTLQNLPKSMRPDVVIVCPSTEVLRHRNNWEFGDESPMILAQPDDAMTIAQKRKWILDTLCVERGWERIVMLDDDLRFAVRRKDDPGKFLKAEPEEIIRYFQELEVALCEETPHAGFAARGGAINDAAKRGGWQTAKRMMYALGYHVPTVLREVELGRIETREDMDVTLQLLVKGFPNLVSYDFHTDQQFANAGGCTDERTIERSNADASRLADLFPEYVRIAEKQYERSIPRLEVVVQWQRALADGIQRKQAR